MDIPKEPTLPKTLEEKSIGKRIIIVLERASLETIKTKKGYELLNADLDSHKIKIKNMKKDISDYRPDILHQCLMALLDSPLNKRGLLQVYIHTNNNILIEVNPHIRIPRTYPRFAGLMVQLLHKMSIKAVNTNEKLLKIIKNPVTNYFPINSIKYLTSHTGRYVQPISLIQTISHDQIVFVFGAHAHGPVQVDYIDDDDNIISFSDYGLSGSTAINRLLSAIEYVWDIK